MKAEGVEKYRLWVTEMKKGMGLYSDNVLVLLGSLQVP